MEDLERESEELVTKCRGLSQRVAVYVKRLVAEGDALGGEVKSLQTAIAALEAQAKSEAHGTEKELLLSTLQQARAVLNGLGPGGDLRRLLNPKSPLLLRLLLGRRTSVTTLRPEESVAMRHEYHSFRDRAVWIMMVVPLALVLGLRRADQMKDNQEGFTFTPFLMTGVQFYLAWLSYYYLALAIRENVLLMNGSNIRSWWIQHHYWSAVACLLMVGLPVSSPAVYQFCETFLLFSCFQALVMMMQNRYQRRRMYTRIALGKNSAMDVVSGESSGSSGQLLLLYPLLFFLQLWQFFVGADVAYKTLPAVLSAEGWLDQEPSESDLRGMRGIFFTGLLFAFMAIMNFTNTLATLREKRSYRRVRKVLSKAQLAPEGQGGSD